MADVPASVSCRPHPVDIRSQPLRYVGDVPAVALVLVDALVSTNLMSLSADAAPAVPVVPVGPCWAGLRHPADCDRLVGCALRWLRTLRCLCHQPDCRPKCDRQACARPDSRSHVSSSVIARPTYAATAGPVPIWISYSNYCDYAWRVTRSPEMQSICRRSDHYITELPFLSSEDVHPLLTLSLLTAVVW